MPYAHRPIRLTLVRGSYSRYRHTLAAGRPLEAGISALLLVRPEIG